MNTLKRILAPTDFPRLGNDAVMGSVSRFLAYYAPCDVLVV